MQTDHTLLFASLGVEVYRSTGRGKWTGPEKHHSGSKMALQTGAYRRIFSRSTAENEKAR